MRSSYFLALSLFLVVAVICLFSVVSPAACRVPQAPQASTLPRSVLWGNGGRKHLPLRMPAWKPAQPNPRR